MFETGTFIPQPNEVGASRNSNFGLAAGVPTLDPDLKRPYNWSYSVTIRHELLPRLSLNYPLPFKFAVNGSYQEIPVAQFRPTTP